MCYILKARSRLVFDHGRLHGRSMASCHRGICTLMHIRRRWYDPKDGGDRAKHDCMDAGGRTNRETESRKPEPRTDQETASRKPERRAMREHLPSKPAPRTTSRSRDREHIEYGNNKTLLQRFKYFISVVCVFLALACCCAPRFAPV